MSLKCIIEYVERYYENLIPYTVKNCLNFLTHMAAICYFFDIMSKDVPLL